MSPGNLIWGGSSATVLYLIRYDSLLQNATAILLQKCDIGLLQNAPGFLLQNVTVLLQNATVITNSDSYYMRCLLQIVTVHNVVFVSFQKSKASFSF